MQLLRQESGLLGLLEGAPRRVRDSVSRRYHSFLSSLKQENRHDDDRYDSTNNAEYRYQG